MMLNAALELAALAAIGLGILALAAGLAVPALAALIAYKDSRP